MGRVVDVVEQLGTFYNKKNKEPQKGRKPQNY
jgi:hypothetical protein